MRISRAAIDRPLPVFLLAALVVFGGFWCLNDLPVKRTPDVEIPYALIAATYVGADPDEIESEIVLELEEKLNTLDNLRHMTSVSKQGYASVILEFEDRSDMTESLRDARDKVSLAQPEFPEEADLAVVHELSFDDLPIIFFTLHGVSDLYRLRDLAEELEPVLEAVPGVSRVDIFGGLEREVQVRANPAALASYGLTLADLARALGRHGENRPTGSLHGDAGSRRIRATGEFHSVEQILEIPVRSERRGSLRVRDVASVDVSHVRLTSGAWIDNEPSVTLIVKRRPDVNTLATVEALREVVDDWRDKLPPGVEITTTSDSSVIIGDMVRQLGTSAAFGLALVVIVLLLMFGVRWALLVGSVLPCALLTTFIGLWIFEMEISNIALFSLILVLGLVVDGAIIVGEAVVAEGESGADAVTAAKRGIDRVGMPVIAADLTTVAAFLPMLLMIGVMGQFMSVMPKVVAFALVGSILVDHFVLPAAAARLKLKPRKEIRNKAPDGLPWVSPALPRIRRAYAAALARAMARRGRVLAGASLAFAATLAVFQFGLIDSIFLPTADRGRFTVDYSLPLGTPIEETNRIGRRLVEEVEKLPELELTVLTTGDTGALSEDNREGGRTGPEYGRVSVELVESSERSRSQSDIVKDLRGLLVSFAGVEIDLEELGEGPDVGAALAIRVQGDDLETLIGTAEEVRERVAALPSVTDVRMDFDRSHPVVDVELDRARAGGDLEILPDAVSNALLMAFHGVEVGRMWLGDERVDIRVQAEEAPGESLDRVRELPMRAADGSLIPLGEVANVDFGESHDAIYRYDSQRAITVRADAIEGGSSVALESSAREALAEMVLAKGIRISFGGETEERDRSYASLWNALKWGALLIYCIIAVQFNSLRQPWIVLMTVPLAIVGVIAGLLVTGIPFSFMVFIGIVSLVGIVVNDGIVLVDAINQNRAAGLPISEAIYSAAESRLRPVLLTTITTIAGLLPLTLNLASGGEFWVPLGVAIISGLCVSSLLTLFVIPILYSLFERESVGSIHSGPDCDPQRD